MSNLEQLVSKISADSNAKVKEILDDANKRSQEMIAAKVAEANSKKESILSEAKAEAVRTKNQIISGHTLEMRDNKLKAKQEVIGQIFDQAIVRLKDLSKEDYLNFVCNYLLLLPISGEEEILFAKQYPDIDLFVINLKLQEAGKKGELRPYTGEKVIDGGFLLVKEGIENNNTYESLIDYFREDLEREVVENLF